MPAPIGRNGSNDVFWNGHRLGIAAPVWWTVPTVGAGATLPHVPLFGRRVLAFAGMMLAARSTAGNPSLGDGLELVVAAAVIIGGTSVVGGTGSIAGSVTGAIFMAIIGLGLRLMGGSTSVQEIIEGAIIVLAVSVNRRRPGVVSPRFSSPARANRGPAVHFRLLR